VCVSANQKSGYGDVVTWTTILVFATVWQFVCLFVPLSQQSLISTTTLQPLDIQT